MAKQRLSFKREPRPTGLASVGYPHRGSIIKLNGKYVGNISAPNWQTKDRLFRVRFMVHDDEDCSGWKWIQMTYRGESDDQCREFIKDNWDAICEKYDLRTSDD